MTSLNVTEVDCCHFKNVKASYVNNISFLLIIIFYAVNIDSNLYIPVNFCMVILAKLYSCQKCYS